MTTCVSVPSGDRLKLDRRPSQRPTKLAVKSCMVLPHIGLTASAREVVVPPLPMPPPGFTFGDGNRRNSPRPPLSGEPVVRQLADCLSEEMAVRQREGQEARQVMQLAATEVQDARQRAVAANQQLEAVQSAAQQATQQARAETVAVQNEAMSQLAVAQQALDESSREAAQAKKQL